MRPVVSLAAALVLSAGAAGAAEPYLVRNLRTVYPEGLPDSSDPESVAAAGPWAFFCTGLSFPLELWMTDGTAAGSRNLTEETPGLGCPGDVYAVGETVYLNHRGRLWRVDGSGVQRVEPHGVPGSADGPTIVGSLATGEILFSSRIGGSPVPGVEDSVLWATDGTPEGTRFLAPISAGPAFVTPGVEARTAAGLVFSAFSDATGREPWVTDGTAQGTRLLAEPLPGPDSGLLRFLTPIDGGRAVFLGRSGPSPNRIELWGTDGTTAGTRMLADLDPQLERSRVEEPLLPAGGLAFFLVENDTGDTWWRSDGTPAGTVPIPLGDAQPQPAGFDGFDAATADGTLIFAASDPEHGFEPWVADAAGGRLLADLCSGECGSSARNFRRTSLGLTFNAIETPDFEGELPLWVSDGTVAGTRRLAPDLCAPQCSDGVALLVGDLGGRLVFQVTTDAGMVQVDLWVTDGTAAGTRRLTGENFFGADFDAGAAAVPGGLVVFAGEDREHGLEPWVSDGTPAGTGPLVDVAREIDGSSNPEQFLQLGERSFFFADDGLSVGLWETDGTVAGTASVKRDLIESPHLEFPSDDGVFALTAWRDELFFVVRKEFGDVDELWRSDGSPSGTVRLATVPADSFDAPHPLLVPGDDEIFYLGEVLWRLRSDPGTAQELAPVTVATSNGSVYAGGRLYFAGSEDPESDFAEPWVSDGTAVGTRRLADIAPGLASSGPRDFAAFRGRVYFTAARDGERALWVSDGTAGGTRLALELDNPPGARSPALLGVAGGRLIIANPQVGEQSDYDLLATDATAAGTRVVGEVNGRFPRAVFGGRVWVETTVTDGTPAGTRDFSAWLPDGAELRNLVVRDGRLLMFLTNRFDDEEIWVSDGTAAGTRRAARPRLQPQLSTVGMLGDLLLFRDEAPGLGAEPWAVATDPPLGPAGPPGRPFGLTAEAVSTGAIRLDWNTAGPQAEFFRVRALWSLFPFGTGFFTVGDVPGDATGVVVSGLAPDLPLTFEVRAENADGVSDWSAEASATPLPEPGPCTPSDERLCLLDGRFAVTARWRDQHNREVGVGRAEPFEGSDRTGGFWFFDPDNVELIVKQLDGRAVNDHFWSFYGALSDVGYWITVTDTFERRSRTYRNPPGVICGRGDTSAFPEVAGATGTVRSGGLAAAELPAIDLGLLAAALGDFAEPQDPPSSPAVRGIALARRPLASTPAAGTAGACQPSPTVLCLRDGRYRVEVTWHDQHNGGDGVGGAVPGTDESGYFWFFDSSNVELVVKILDGTTVNGHVWVFYGGLSDVEYTITVTDTATGTPRTYHNELGEICGGADLSAF